MQQTNNRICLSVALMAKTRGQAARGNNEKPFKKLTSIVLLLFDTILDFMLLF